jgi:nucleotide-binding universal stress UspA family protein
MSVPAVRRIVVGVDGSADSVIALRWACREAAIRGAEVHAVHVCEGPLHSPASYAVPAPEDSCTIPADDAQMWKAALADLPQGIRVRTESAVGLVARVLLDRCRGADMLVLGTSDEVPDQAWSAGPVIRACLRRSPCPVVVISSELDSGWGHDAGREIVPRDVPEPAGTIAPAVAAREGMPVGVGA